MTVAIGKQLALQTCGVQCKKVLSLLSVAPVRGTSRDAQNSCPQTMEMNASVVVCVCVCVKPEQRIQINYIVVHSGQGVGWSYSAMSWTRRSRARLRTSWERAVTAKVLHFAACRLFCFS